MNKQLVWWGRSDPDYSRNRIIRNALHRMGWEIIDFHPMVPKLGDIEARLRGITPAKLIWVPCFRQRDLASALRYGSLKGLPVIADPLISAWDKQVFERKKFCADSNSARRLLRWESRLLQACQAVMVDTPAHARFFADHLRVPEESLRLLWVGAEEDLFLPSRPESRKKNLEALFFGSFIGLHGIDTIISAARLSQRTPITWTLLGEGPERQKAEAGAVGLSNVRFESPVRYTELPARIAAADIVLGVFGKSGKAGRVIPNKVFQGLACSRPVVTRISAGFPLEIPAEDSGLLFVPAEDPTALANTMHELASNGAKRESLGNNAAQTFRSFFGHEVIESQLSKTLNSIQIT